MSDHEEVRFTIDTPLGPFSLAMEGDRVRGASFGPGGGGPPSGPAAAALAARVRAYFAGDARALDGAAVDGEGTPFQRQVWRELRRIPPGEVRTYGQLARALGRPGAARAVGGACARNPVALLVPCHRAVGTGGALTGYAFGTGRKRWLIEHEAHGAGGRGRIAAACSASAGPSPSSSPR
jgi:methylated-DNA-[protein]-cysteine S-methyltransferase